MAEEAVGRAQRRQLPGPRHWEQSWQLGSLQFSQSPRIELQGRRGAPPPRPKPNSQPSEMPPQLGLDRMGCM